MAPLQRTPKKKWSEREVEREREREQERESESGWVRVRTRRKGGERNGARVREDHWLKEKEAAINHCGDRT